MSTYLTDNRECLQFTLTTKGNKGNTFNLANIQLVVARVIRIDIYKRCFTLNLSSLTLVDTSAIKMKFFKTLRV